MSSSRFVWKESEFLCKREVRVFRELSPQTEAAFKKQFKSGLDGNFPN